MKRHREVTSHSRSYGEEFQRRATLEKEKPPVFGMIQHGGQVVIRMLENVK